MNAKHFEQMLVFYLMVVVATPAPPAVARKAPFFDFDQQHFQRQPAVRENTREVHQLFKHIQQRSLLRG